LEKRILVVDDDDAIRTLLVTVLRKRRFIVDDARNGEEAIERARLCRYSIVLLDLMMPRLNGYEFLGQIEEWPKHQRPLVIVLTAGTEPRDLDPDIVAGTIRKPFDIELLVDTVSACIQTLGAQEQHKHCPPEGDLEQPADKPN